MKVIQFVLLLILGLNDSKGQQILVDHLFNGFTVYGQHASRINSESELPYQIKIALETYLSEMVGSNIKNVTFSHGQYIDLKSYFSEPNRKVSSFQGDVPAYDLNFVLSDTTLGIKVYFLKLLLDEYGQLLTANWPRKGYSNKEMFQSTGKIVQFALEQAKMRGFLVSKYETDLKFNPNSESLNWVFKFPRTLDPDNKQFEVIEISMTLLRVVDEYAIVKTVYH